MPEEKKIHCNLCKHETNHIMISSHNRDYLIVGKESGQRYIEYYEKSRFGFWVCKGCDTATLEEKYTLSGMYDANGDDSFEYVYSPKRNNKYQRETKKFKHLDKKLYSLYSEIINAYNQGLGIISAMGIRALLEGICVEEGIVDKVAYNLGKKIKELKIKHDIPESIIEGIEGLKIIGDDAAHRLSSSNKNTLLLSIELLEALLTHLYEAKFELQHKADKVTFNRKETST